MNLFETGEKLGRDSERKISVKYLYKKCGSYQRKTLTGWLWKLKFCSEANQNLLFKKLQNNNFHSRPIHGANISQIFSFTRTTSSHNIQLVPNIQNTSFHIPVKSSIDSRAVVATIQFVPKYKSKVKLISKYFYSQEPQAHITFNSSQIFKTHLSMFETRLTNPERQMKHENRLSLFLTV